MRVVRRPALGLPPGTPRSARLLIEHVPVAHPNRFDVQERMSTRLRIALAVVIVAALLPAATVIVQVTGNPKLLLPRDDPMSAFERHVAPLREVLRTETVVGYLPPSSQGVDRVAHLYSLRYALSPLKVLKRADLPLVIADGVGDARRLPPELRVRRDFGGGLLLLERAP